MSAASAKEEEAIFDRQTRLWGVEAQAQIRSSRVFVRGPFLGLSAEICKNLALAGVNLVLQRDTHAVELDDICCNVFFHVEDAENKLERTSEPVLNRLREMTFATITCEEEEKVDISQYKIVVSVNESFAVMRKLGRKCRAAGVPLLCCREAGMLGFALLDFGKEFAFRRDDDSAPPGTAKFASLDDLLDFKDFDRLNKKTGFGFFAILLAVAQQEADKQQSKRIKLENRANVQQDDLERAIKLFASPPSEGSMPPVCTILGGLIGNEVLKAVSGKGEPSNNVIFFDGKDAGATVRQIPPPQ